LLLQTHAAAAQQAEEDKTALKCQLYDCSNDVARWSLDAFRQDVSSLTPLDFSKAVLLATAVIARFHPDPLLMRAETAIWSGISTLSELADLEARRADADSLSILHTMLDTMQSRSNQAMWSVVSSLVLGALRVTVTAMVHYPRINKTL